MNMNVRVLRMILVEQDARGSSVFICGEGGWWGWELPAIWRETRLQKFTDMQI